MRRIEVQITDPIGLHARPASFLCQEAGKYESDIFLKKDTTTANLKSIMNIMSLGIKTGETVIIEAEGKDEDQAIDALIKTMQEQKIID